MAEEYLWTYREPTIGEIDISGYDVEATDGSLGTIDEASYEAGAGYIVVDTSSWKNLGMGQQSLLPAGVITRIDSEEEQVHVDLSKDQIKDAPEYEGTVDTAYREQVAGYYEPLYPRERVVRR